MWYSTDYIGSAKISPELKASTIVLLKQAIEEAHEESSWALEISKDYQSIVWRWCEKTRDFEQALNAVEDYMRTSIDDFTLEWEFEYQWEESEDRGYIRKVDGKFVRVEKVMQKDEYKCPDCWHIFKS